jgi:GTPase SAR1 family protein
MGSGGVGKSAITIRFVNRQFEAKVTLKIGNGQLTLHIICFSNSESFNKIEKIQKFHLFNLTTQNIHQILFPEKSFGFVSLSSLFEFSKV